MHGRRFRHDDVERLKWQNPEEILKSVNLGKGHTFIDVGCGGGFFALPAARIVGKNGRVYGVDIDEQAIENIKQAALEEGLANIILKINDAERTVFCEGCADFVFFGINLHDFWDPILVLDNARKMLKPKGRLVDLDWKKEKMSIGPPFEKRFSQEDATHYIENAGFKVDTVRDSGHHLYLIVATLQ